MSRSHAKPSENQRKERFRSADYRFADDIGAHDTTCPDIVPASLRFADEPSFPPSNCDRYWDAEAPAYGDFPELRLAYHESREEAPRAVLLHPAKRELCKADRGSDARNVLLGRALRHPLVIKVRDLIDFDGEPLLVMDYAPGVTLASLLRQWSPMAPSIAVAVACDVLRALHAGHRATSDRGEPLELVHGCLSPREIIVTTDGRAHIVDFALAEDMGRTLVERVDRNRGYVAPEQVFERRIDARTDVFSAAAVLWESLTGYALLAGDDPVEQLLKLMTLGCDLPSRFNAEVPPELDRVIARALDPSPERRFQSASEFANALTATLRPASPSDVAERVQTVAKANLEEQEERRLRASEAPPSRTRSVLVTRAKSDPPRGERAPVAQSRSFPRRDAREDVTVPFPVLETRSETTVPDRALEPTNVAPPSQAPETIPIVAPPAPPQPAPRKIATVRPDAGSLRVRTGSFSEVSGVGARSRKTHRLSLFIVAGAVAFAAAFTLALSSFDSPPMRAMERIPITFSTASESSRPVSAEASASPNDARPSEDAALAGDVPVVSFGDLPLSKRRDSKSKRRHSVPTRGKPAR
ncbi:MAG TPA: serine/threonine-protein kinase [Polyangiaceae bacterium]|nr:serine/threonine-protein kinase [Polyangiaceae bacterium]